MSASAGKKKTTFLAKQARKDKIEPVTEEELLRKDSITPDDVLRLHKVSDSKFDVGDSVDTTSKSARQNIQ